MFSRWKRSKSSKISNHRQCCVPPKLPRSNALPKTKAAKPTQLPLPPISPSLLLEKLSVKILWPLSSNSNQILLDQSVSKHWLNLCHTPILVKTSPEARRTKSMHPPEGAKWWLQLPPKTKSSRGHLSEPTTTPPLNEHVE